MAFYLVVAPQTKPLTKKEKEELRKRSSKLAFSMPCVEPPEVLEALRTEKMARKLIRYMKKSWKVEVDPSQAERDLVFR